MVFTILILCWKQAITTWGPLSPQNNSLSISGSHANVKSFHDLNIIKAFRLPCSMRGPPCFQPLMILRLPSCHALNVRCSHALLLPCILKVIPSHTLKSQKSHAPMLPCSRLSYSQVRPFHALNTLKSQTPFVPAWGPPMLSGFSRLSMLKIASVPQDLDNDIVQTKFESYYRHWVFRHTTHITIQYLEKNHNS